MTCATLPLIQPTHSLCYLFPPILFCSNCTHQLQLLQLLQHACHIQHAWTTTHLLLPICNHTLIFAISLQCCKALQFVNPNFSLLMFVIATASFSYLIPPNTMCESPLIYPCIIFSLLSTETAMSAPASWHRNQSTTTASVDITTTWQHWLTYFFARTRHVPGVYLETPEWTDSQPLVVRVANSPYEHFTVAILVRFSGVVPNSFTYFYV